MGKKVMLADDDEGVLAFVAATLGNDSRYSLVRARDGDEALALARKELPELIFLDVVMPGMDGYAVCQTLKESPPTQHIKIVMLTALFDEANRERAGAIGADGFMTKPFSPISLLEKVSEVLGLK